VQWRYFVNYGLRDVALHDLCEETRVVKLMQVALRVRTGFPGIEAAKWLWVEDEAEDGQPHDTSEGSDDGTRQVEVFGKAAHSDVTQG
jgi:hypothetical protein